MVCGAGTCAPMCPAGSAFCSGGCVPAAQLKVDPLHCGMCGTPCAVGEACVGGGCIPYFAPPDCNACPCPQCGVSNACCMMSGTTFPICVPGTLCPP
jgi:hypothetical protein